MKKASRKIPEMPFLLRIAALFYLGKIKEMVVSIGSEYYIFEVSTKMANRKSGRRI